MFARNRVLAVIPARGGSKGIPRKNIHPLNGWPLIKYTIDAALAAASLSRVVVSTDDQEIASISEKLGSEVLIRPEEFSTDEAPGVAPVLHAIEVLKGFDYVVLLQPTSPLRSAWDIDAAIESCINLDAPACVSVCKAEKSPYWMYWVNNCRMEPVLISDPENNYRRQDLAVAYALNGAIYVAKTDWLLKRKSFLSDETVAYEMPVQRSIDIDTGLDLLFCEFLMGKSAIREGLK
ncbi:acylneuraminate cytidylyltransferase family protein [Pseudomonas resinovorans]|uniref:acylneuraminate cytidylyltransferase family protein n=1 Tax=Metapseudomonas resinovorans TaxID=53412 RepID=UPI00237FBD9D|nr:acylneuraminate cytidylyltransferase family protein [Pseudomonas resinovorans]MDE3740186.1 acylneuraminate cytidylyltransferase family protein [Pseudomonas resinovorans]